MLAASPSMDLRSISGVNLSRNFQARGGIGGKLAYGTPKCKELCGRHQILLAVVNCHWHPGLAQHGGGREPDLGEPYPKGVRGFETVWYVDCHLVSQAAIAF